MATTNFEAAHAAVVAALRGIAQCTVGPVAPIAPSSSAWAPDFFVELTGPWGARRLACRIEAALHPKKAHGCQLAFADWLRHTPSQDAYPVVLAPFVSEASSLLLAQSTVGFVGSAGNVLLDLPGVYLDRRVPGNVIRERSAVRPLFTPRGCTRPSRLADDSRTLEGTALVGGRPSEPRACEPCQAHAV